MEQLRARVYEIEDLWHHEKQYCLAEIAQDSHDSKNHPSKICEGIAAKSPCRIPDECSVSGVIWPSNSMSHIPVVLQVAKCCANER